MNPPNHIARWIAAGVSVFALAGAGSVMATTEPPDTTAATDDTSMASEPADTSMGSEPTGAGPSDCPAIVEGAAGTAAEGTEAAGTEAEGTEAAGTEAAGTEAAGTEAAGTEAAEATEMATETTAAADASTADSMAEGSEAPVDGPAVQIVETDEYGPILVDGECFTLYAFTPDSEGGGDSTCFDECAANWPPLFAEEVPALADELDPSLFGIAEHPDGAMLKIGDWPLYYFAGDAAPGEINGQGVGDVWWVVAPDGTLIETVEGSEGTEAAEGSDAAEATEAADTAAETTEG
jgi:predicted lipoprotein with Yx(FWY)xxD motif